MKQECVLTVDIGTSSTRVSLFDSRLKQIGCRSAKTENASALDAKACWVQICTLGKALMADHRQTDIRAVGVSSQLAWLCIDEAGEPVAPAQTWMDQSPEQMRLLEDQIGADSVYEKTARRLSSEHGGLKLARLRQENPGAYKRARAFLSLKDYINFKFCGKVAMDRTYACYTLLYNPRTGIWDTDLLRALKIDASMLHALLGGSDTLGLTTENCEFPIPAGIPVAASGPDGTVGVLGAGGVSPGVTVNIMGTTDVFFSCCDSFVEDKNRRLIVNPHVAAGQWVVGGPMGLSGGSADWVVNTLMGGRISFDEINEQAAKIPLGSEGLVMNCGLNGERVPFWNARMAGSVYGIRPHHTAAHLFRAVMESNSCAVRRLCDYSLEAGIAVREIVAIGGATKHESWPQIKADITGLPVLLPEITEATGMGCAMLAWHTAGIPLASQPSAHTHARQYIPDSACKGAADRLYKRYQALIDSASKYYGKDWEEK